MANRRKFLKLSALGTGALATGTACSQEAESTQIEPTPAAKPVKGVKPIVVSTWRHGKDCNVVAWDILQKGGYALDAVEKGVNVVENDPEVTTVGYGGMPDANGDITLDACIMNELSQCGSVGALQHIKTPISVARKVMEETPHVMLVAKGANQFATKQGFVEEDLMTETARKAYEEWSKAAEFKLPPVNVENHDTIGALALDTDGRLSGACTTSGAAFKMPGRIGDSPLIAAGLFVDGDVGAACATGVGEAIIRIAGSSLVVELMRQGRSPQQACEEAVQRVVEKHTDYKDLQVGFLALNKNGEYGAYAMYQGFDYAVKSAEEDQLIPSGYQFGN